MLQYNPEARFPSLNKTKEAIENYKGKRHSKKDPKLSNATQMVKDSYDRCKNQDDFIKLFYDDFFTESKESSKKFTDFEEQKNKLDIAIDRLVSLSFYGLDKDMVKDWSKRHKERGVTFMEYELFSNILIKHIEITDKENWDEELKQSWEYLLKEVINKMKKYSI